MINITGTYTDQYQLAMAQVCFLKGQHERIATFDYFFVLFLLKEAMRFLRVWRIYWMFSNNFALNNKI